MPNQIRVLVTGDRQLDRVRRAFARAGHHVDYAPMANALEAVNDSVEAVLIAARRDDVLALTRRLKTRFQMPLLPVVALATRPASASSEVPAPDAWLPANSRPRDVVARLEELVRIRRTEGELVRLNTALAELAAENGRLYDRARRDAEATTVLLRELQHRVRNNLATIQALLVLERHRSPPRPLHEALDVAVARLRSMAALQDSLVPNAESVELATLAQAVTRGALEIFGAAGAVRYEVTGNATLPARSASAVAIVLNELVTNALKHANASTVRVEICDSDRGLELVVADDGRGMPAEPSGGSGLMIARAVVRNELSGQLTVDLAPRGTRMRITIPHATRVDRPSAPSPTAAREVRESDPPRAEA